MRLLKNKQRGVGDPDPLLKRNYDATHIPQKKEKIIRLCKPFSDFLNYNHHNAWYTTPFPVNS